VTEGSSSSAPRIRNLIRDGLGRIRSAACTLNGVTATNTFSYGPSPTYAYLSSASNTVTGPNPYTVTQQYGYFPAAQGGFLQTEATSQGDLTFTTTYNQYTQFGDVEAITYPSGRTVTYGLDGLGRMENVAQNSTRVLSSICYDPWGNLGTMTFVSGATEAWTPDSSTGRPWKWCTAPASGPPQTWVYAFDATSGWLVGSGEWTLNGGQADPINRLTSATQNWLLPQVNGGPIVETLLYDPCGNNITSNASPSTVLPASWNNFALASPLMGNQLPQHTSNGSGSILPFYDAYGELIQVSTAVSSNQSLNLAWDSLGRLAGTSETQTGDTQTYQYTPSGLRVNRLDSQDPIQSAYYAYTSGGKLLTEFTQPNATQDIGQAVSATGVVYGPTTSTHGGLQAARIWHKTGNNSEIDHFLGTFPAGDTLTTTIWVNAPAGTLTQVFIGNAGGSAPTYTDCAANSVMGTGTWQQLSVTLPSLSRSVPLWLYLYCNCNTSASTGTFTVVDDITVTSALAPAQNFWEGFEAGLAFTATYGNPTGWHTSATGCDVLTASSSTTFSGQGALEIIHQNGTGSSVWHELGSYLVGDMLTVTVWLNAPVGTSGQVFLGNVNVPNAYDNATSIEVPGTGTWQAVTLCKQITGQAGSSRDMQVFLYGNVVNGQTPANGTYSCWDEITVANSVGVVFHDGFENGLSSSWVTSGQPNVNLQNLVARDVIYLGGRAIAEVDNAGVVHELHCDHLGTPRLITNGSTGVIEGVQTFGPYGESLQSWGYVPLTGYTGHVQT